MSFDKYSDKASEAIALIREFAKVEYWDYFKGDPEQALEAFCAMQDAAEEMGRQECAAKTDSQKIYKDFDEFWKTAPSNYAKDRYTIEFSIGIWEAAYKAALSQDSAAPQDNVPGVSELPVVKTWQERAYESGAEKLMAVDALEFAEAEIADLRAALRAYGQRAAVASNPVSYWLVESVHGCGWWDGRFLSRGIDPRHFTHDPGKAVRLSRKEDADRICSQSSSLKATEHVWIDAAAPSQLQQEAVPAEPSEQDKLDAERYRWLRDQDIHSQVGSFTPYAVQVIQGQINKMLDGKELDKACDAAIAMSAAKEPGNE